MMGVICPNIDQLEVIKCVKSRKYLGLLFDSVVQKWLSIEVSGQLKRGGSDAERQAAMSNKPPGLQKDMMGVVCASISQLEVSGNFSMANQSALICFGGQNWDQKSSGHLYAESLPPSL